MEWADWGMDARQVAAGLAAAGDARAGEALAELRGLWREVGLTQDEVAQGVAELAEGCARVFDARVEAVRRERDALRASVAESEMELERVCARLGEERRAPPARLGRMSLREYQGQLGAHLDDALARAAARAAPLRALSARLVAAEADRLGVPRADDLAVRAAARRLAEAVGSTPAGGGEPDPALRLVLGDDDAAACDLSGRLARTLEAARAAAEDDPRQGHVPGARTGGGAAPAAAPREAAPALSPNEEGLQPDPEWLCVIPGRIIRLSSQHTYLGDVHIAQKDE